MPLTLGTGCGCLAICLNSWVTEKKIVASCSSTVLCTSMQNKHCERSADATMKVSLVPTAYFGVSIEFVFRWHFDIKRWRHLIPLLPYIPDPVKVLATIPLLGRDPYCLVPCLSPRHSNPLHKSRQYI